MNIVRVTPRARKANDDGWLWCAGCTGPWEYYKPELRHLSVSEAYPDPNICPTCGKRRCARCELIVVGGELLVCDECLEEMFEEGPVDVASLRVQTEGKSRAVEIIKKMVAHDARREERSREMLARFDDVMSRMTGDLGTVAQDASKDVKKKCTLRDQIRRILDELIEKYSHDPRLT